MPQLDFLCFHHQYNWMILSILIFYYLNYTLIESLSIIKWFRNDLKITTSTINSLSTNNKLNWTNFI